LQNVPLYDPSEHCIDYINLTSPSTHATYGSFANPSQTQGVMDNGAASILSRHTVNYVSNIYDPRSLYGLRTVPQGEVASVRLGNWEIGSQAESITYDYTVGQEGGILLLKYAVMMHDPSASHSAATQPRFKLDILDQNNQYLGGQLCGSADFVPGDAGVGWNHLILNGEPAVWKDWTTVGVALQPYIGQQIKIRLTTYDCSQSGHFGYAYFTLSCMSATIESTSCGSSSSISVNAPEGFNYEWRKLGNPAVLGWDQTFDVTALDSGTYTVDMIYKEEPLCRFQLRALMYPRVPVARANYFYQPADCKNIVRMINTSGIRKSDADTTMLTGESPSSFYWDLGDGRTSTEKAPVVEYPNTGGTYTVKLAVGISDDLCMDTTEFVMTLPEIKDTIVVFPAQICLGKSYVFDDVTYTAAGDYPIYKKTRAGCDSTTILSLQVVDKIRVALVDSICWGEPYTFNEQTFIQTASLRQYQSLNLSSAGCDSITTLDLFMRPKPNFVATVQNALTGPNTGSITLNTLPAGYTYEVNGVSNGALINLPVGDYDIVVYDKKGCPSDVQTHTVATTCIDVAPQQPQPVCADDNIVSLPYILNKGTIDQYTLIFDNEALKQGFANVAPQPITVPVGLPSALEFPIPADVRPDTYSVIVKFYDLNCADEYVDTVQFEVQYSDKVVQQKWNDVLAVLNDRYNGGYFFSGFQWYRNGVKIPGETGSYYYLGEAAVFNNIDTYQVGLQRVGENYFVLSCDIATTLHGSDITLYPTLVNSYQPVLITSAANNVSVRVFDSMGQLRIARTFSGGTSTMNMPAQTGVYMVELTEDTGARRMVQVIVR
jgi:PKD repeat protein